MLSCAFVLATLVLVWKSQVSSMAKGAVTRLGTMFFIGVGASRLYLGVHYPSDVLAGFALAFSWIALLQCIFQRRLVSPLEQRRLFPYPCAFCITAVLVR